MSGFEVFGLVTGIVTMVEATLKIYRAAQNTSELPESFRWAASRLPLLRNTLSTVERRLADPGRLRADPPQEAVSITLQACRDKAEALRIIFTETLSPRDAPWLDRWKRGRQQLKMADRVRDLVSEMDKDLQALVGNQVLGGVMTNMQGYHDAPDLDTEALRAGVYRKPDVCRATTTKGQPMRLYNIGTGHQIVHAGYGNQINNFGSGPHLTGPISAPISFTYPGGRGS